MRSCHTRFVRWWRETKETDMTHITPTKPTPPAGWERWFAEAGIDYVEVARCPLRLCRICRPEGDIAAAA